MVEISERGIRAEFIHHRPHGLMLAESGQLYEGGIIPLRYTEVMPLGSAAEVHWKLESGRTRGKLALRVKSW